MPAVHNTTILPDDCGSLSWPAIKVAVRSSNPAKYLRDKLKYKEDVGMLRDFALAHPDIFVCYMGIKAGLSDSDCDELLSRVGEQIK